MELKRYLRVVGRTGDDDDDYSMVEISNRRAREAADRIERLEAALRIVINWDSTLESEDGLDWGEVMDIASKEIGRAHV
jgi:hypothetical protein